MTSPQRAVTSRPLRDLLEIFVSMSEPGTATTFPADPLAGIKALLDERAACEERVKAINIELQKARGMIDARTLGAPRKPRIAAVPETPEPPDAA